MGIQPLMPRDEQRNCVSNCFETESRCEKKSLACYDDILFPYPRQANKKLDPATQRWWQEIKCATNKAGQVPSSPAKLVHAQACMYNHTRTPTPEKHNAVTAPRQHTWPIRNASCLLKVGEKRDEDQVKFPLFFRFFAHNSLRPLPLILHLSFFFF